MQHNSRVCRVQPQTSHLCHSACTSTRRYLIPTTQGGTGICWIPAGQAKMGDVLTLQLT